MYVHVGCRMQTQHASNIITENLPRLRSSRKLGARHAIRHYSMWYTIQNSELQRNLLRGLKNV